MNNDIAEQVTQIHEWIADSQDKLNEVYDNILSMETIAESIGYKYHLTDLKDICKEFKALFFNYDQDFKDEYGKKEKEYWDQFDDDVSDLDDIDWDLINED